MTENDCQLNKDITRRQFFAGAIKLGLASAAGTAGLGALQGCAKKDLASELAAAAKAIAPNANIINLDVTDDRILLGTEMSEVPSDNYLHEIATYALPADCLLYQDSEKFALVLQSKAGQSNGLELNFAKKPNPDNSTKTKSESDAEGNPSAESGTSGGGADGGASGGGASGGAGDGDASASEETSTNNDAGTSGNAVVDTQNASGSEETEKDADASNDATDTQSDSSVAESVRRNGELIAVNLLDLQNGEVTELLTCALGDDSDYVIYDARANDSVLLWVECQMISGNWRVYGAPLNGTARGAETLLEEGDVLYEAPSLCVCGKSAYWTVMPDPNGKASTKDSYLKKATVANGELSAPETVYTSHGRLTCAPQASDGMVTFTPRVNYDTVVYQLNAMRESDNEITDVAILPASLKVSDAVFLNNGFSFCIEGNYDYAGGLRYFGTYKQLSDGKYLFANRTPTSAALSINDCIFIKSTKNIIGFDVANSAYFVIDTIKDCIDYGDVMAGCGAHSILVTYTTIVNKRDVNKNLTQVRVFGPA